MRQLLVLVTILAGLGVSAAGATSPLTGVWKLNPAKSKFSHGDLPLSLVITITEDGEDGIHYSSKNKLVNGSSGGASYTAKFDGQDYPVTGSPSYDHVSIRRVNSRTFQIQMKQGSKVVVDTTYTVSADGKSLTRKGTASYAEVNHFEEWFDRQ